MTAFLTGGMPRAQSRESKALDASRTAGKSFVNKDFTKNLAFLNNVADTHTSWLQKLQSGVDQANENALEQIQSFWGDLFILFGGLEPTGIEIGDVKYIIQGIGAFFGINPDTPFPLNLLEAAEHILTNYIIPLDQFTDVIFDAILAWAEDLGLSPEFIESITELFDAIEDFGHAIGEVFDTLKELFGIFGFLDFTSLSGLGELWDALLELIDGLALEPLKPVLALLADLGVPFINALTAIINAGTRFLTPLSFISGAQIKNLGPNVAPTVANNTTDWTVSGDATNGWQWTAAQSSSSISAGSFTTLGTGVAKRLATQKVYECTPGQKFAVNAFLRWAGIPAGANTISLQAVWYNGLVEFSTSSVSIPNGHGTTGGWSELIGEFTVPSNVDGFKIAVFVGSSINSGQVWFDDISWKLQGGIAMGLIDGLLDLLTGFLPNDFFDGIVGIIGATPSDVADFFLGFLTGNSPLNALNLFNLGNLLGKLPIGNLTNEQVEMLDNADFRESISVQGGGIWTWDGTKGRTVLGSAKVSAGSSLRQLVSNTIAVAQGDKGTPKIFVQWNNLTYTGTQPIKLQIVRMLYNSATQSYAVMGTDTIAGPNSPGANQATWLELSGDYTVPASCSHIVLQLIVGANATAGNIWFDDGSFKKTGEIDMSWIPGLDIFITMINQILDVVQGIIITPINEPIDAFRSWVSELGSRFTNNENDHQGLLDNLFGGFTGFLGGNKSSADVANATSDTAGKASTALELSEWINAIQGLRNNKSLMEGVDETEEANFTTETLFTTSTPQAVIAATSSSVPVAYKRFAEEAKKGFITWFGKDAPGDLRIDIYRANYDTNNWDHIHTSPNLQSMIDNTWRYLQYNISNVLDRVNVSSGIVLGIAWRVVGTGTHSIAGIPDNKPTHPSVHPKKPESVRTGVGNLAFSSTLYTLNSQPWFGIGIIQGDAPPAYNAPRLTEFSTVGNYSFTIEPWVNIIDVIHLSGAGGGHGGNGGDTRAGRGGQAGQWVTEKLVRGIDFPVDATTITGFVGAGGNGGNRESNGSNGQSSYRNAIPGGKAALTANGGLGATNYVENNSQSKGDSPNTQNFEGQNYVGGPGGNGGRPGSPGGTPGGGGGGGYGGIYGVAYAGAAGARGSAWYRARQD